MTPTVAETYAAARSFLGDPEAREFTDSVLQPFYQVAYSDMIAAIADVGGSPPERVGFVLNVAPGASEVDLAAAGLSDVGIVHSVFERRSGGLAWVPVPLASEIAPSVSVDSSGVEVSGGRLTLVPASYQRDLRIKYSTSGIAPASGPVGIPGCMHYMAAKIASLALAVREEGMAGAQAFGSDAAVQLELLVRRYVKQQQATRISRPPFRLRRG